MVIRYIELANLIQTPLINRKRNHHVYSHHNYELYIYTCIFCLKNTYNIEQNINKSAAVYSQSIIVT